MGNVGDGDNHIDTDQERQPGLQPINSNQDISLVPSVASSRSNSLAPITPSDQRSSSPIDGHTISNPLSRMKPIPKPHREAVKNDDGKFVCTWNGCVATVKEFSRKCEWSKHMDKHERPYKCNVEGCGHIPGFTYSGGLLRHEREVHGKHGGPKNPLYCPHPLCKRHTEGRFARLENLNEHIRRCHGPSGSAEPSSSSAQAQSSEEPDNELPSLPTLVIPTHQHQRSESSASLSPNIDAPSPGAAGTKRKAAEKELRGENKRLRFENQELRRKIEAGYLQQGAMMEQIDILQKEKESFANRLKEANLMI
ncbi:hypothetical protein F5Y17DRAFT_469573 [Xylariaceae sp. FL0594]|nr:hypothetical protein F5Y17DRAFT_469573 [Xylariaceae sp. FL0594]